MKTKITLLAVMITAFFFSNAQQVPNNGFDTWTAPGYAPDGWTTYEQIFSGYVSGFASKDTVDEVDGTPSIILTSDSVALDPTQGVIAGMVSTGSGSSTGGAPIYVGIPFAYRPDTLVFDYKYSSPTSDSGFVFIQLTKNFSDTILYYEHPIYANPGWGQFSLILSGAYWNSDVPDTLLLQFGSSFGTNTAAVKGSALNIDNVHFGYANTTGINEIRSQNATVYPNPASDVLNVTSSNDISGSNMEIFDVTGSLVSKLGLEGSSNSINISNLANGTYIYKITNKSSEVISQNKFTVIK